MHNLSADCREIMLWHCAALVLLEALANGILWNCASPLHLCFLLMELLILK